MPKISEMTAATSVSGSAYIAILQSGANEKATVNQILSSPTGEDKIIVCDDGQTVGMQDASINNYFKIDSSTGTVSMEATGPATLHCAGLMTINPGGDLFLKYATANGGWWDNVPPQNVWEALDRLADAVEGLLGVPIP